MSVTVAPKAPPPRPRPVDGAMARTRRPRRRVQPATWESLAVFTVPFVAYAVLGWYVDIHLHGTPFDAAARAAHAYFVLHGDPAKLSAIGFVWPPLMTLVLLPFTAVGALGASFASLPLMSAAFSAGLLTVLHRTYVLLGVPRAGRYALLLALAANPFYARYSTNGMSEVVSLFFVALAAHQLLRWVLDDEDRHLALCGLAWGLGALTRYEIAVYGALVGAALFVLLWRRRVARDRVEGALLLYAVPILYCVGIWVFFNWLITGEPLHFLAEQVRQRFTDYKKTETHGIGEPLSLLASMNWRLFTPTLVVAPLLLAAAVWRRSLVTAVLAGLVALNPLMTGAAMLRAHDLALVQPRFNVRSLPLAMLGVGWLFWLLAGRPRARAALIAGTVLLTVAGYPMTWRLMDTFRFQDQHSETQFVRALSTGRDQNSPELDAVAADGMAAYVRAHVTRPHSILVDDGQGFAPMVKTQRTGLFLDRIYKGDASWLRVRERPRGRVDWMLVTSAGEDLLRTKWPRATAGGVPWLHVRHVAGKYVLLSVDRPPR